MSEALSYPKNKMQIVLVEKVHASAAKVFGRYRLDVETVPNALDNTKVAAVMSRGARARGAVPNPGAGHAPWQPQAPAGDRSSP